LFQEEQATGDGGTSGEPDTWDKIKGAWPVENRPEEMKNRKFVNAFTFDQALKYKEHWLAEQSKQGRGDLVFGKDAPPPLRRFNAAEDNCADVLCTAR